MVAKAKQKLKIFLAEKVCGFFDLAYTAGGDGFPLDWFAELDLVPGFDRSTVEDRITGRHDQVSISLADANLKKRVRSGKRTRPLKEISSVLPAAWEWHLTPP